MSISTVNSLNQTDLKQVLTLLSEQWWSKGRTFEELEKIVEHTDLLFVVRCPDTNKLIGFARVLTDYFYVATIYDVVISSEHQQKGVGKKLVQYILDCPELSEIHHIDLSCKNNLLEFYTELGFEPLDTSMMFLRAYSDSNSER